MKSEILIPLGILLTTGLICGAIVASVVWTIVQRSRRAEEDLQRALAPLIEDGFYFEKGPATWFAPRLARVLGNGLRVTLHFRIPGRGYTGALRYDGVQLWMIETTNNGAAQQRELAKFFQGLPGKLVYESKTRLQWQPAAPSAFQILDESERLISVLSLIS